MILYVVTVFLSAFLLFQVQPIIARAILPWFGGSAAVWTTCMLFFQMALLLGYLYADVTIRRLAPRAQVILHSVLLAASLLVLPILPSPEWKPAGTENPILRIGLVLAVSVGLPYFLLSTTSPLLQAWYARTRHGAMPYRLFALSNLGSMLALLSYPFLVEPRLSTSVQSTVWSSGYALFAVLCSVTAWLSVRHRSVLPVMVAQEEAPAPAPRGATLVMWTLLAACPSALLLALTNHLTQDVAAIPFLWILPLSIYLFTFTLCFDAPRWYWRPGFLTALPLVLGLLTWMQGAEMDDIQKGIDTILPLDLNSLKMGITLFAISFFVCAMVCHGELARRKPHPRYLTRFYLMISIGGALGGVFVGVIAPYAFPSFFEFPIAVGLCGTLAVLAVFEDPGRTAKWYWRLAAAGAAVAGLGVLYLFLGRAMWEPVQNYRLATRNFYGALRVRQSKTAEDWDGYRTFLHGTINHGEQWLHPSRRRTPLTYYCEDTAVGRAMALRRPAVPHRVGVMGLGAGTMAAFGRSVDYYRFYEINPLVEQIARKEFTYLSDTPAKVEIAYGDARLSMEREPPRQFDLLVMDAFSGDSIPVHLITREALELYFRHVKPDGLVAVHISNKYLNLQPVLHQAAADLRKAAVVIETYDSDDGNCFGTTWVLMANDPEVLGRSEIAVAGGTPPESRSGVYAWTDDYSNLFRILK